MSNKILRINPLVSFYDIHEEERGAILYFIPDTTWELNNYLCTYFLYNMTYIYKKVCLFIRYLGSKTQAFKCLLWINVSESRIFIIIYLLYPYYLLVSKLRLHGFTFWTGYCEVSHFVELNGRKDMEYCPRKIIPLM
jgi:hypothetical protein